MESEELDRLLQVMENPVRRRIIRRLSQEPAYALQLSKELGLGQSLIAKHMDVMERAGLVTSVVRDARSGPKGKRWYSLSRTVSIRMDLGPNLFMESGTTFKTGLERPEMVGRLKKRIGDAARREDDGEKLTILSEVLNGVDERMEEIEGERTGLLEVRDLAMREAAIVASRFEELDTRKVLHHILDEHDREVAHISEALNLREYAVRSILEELKEFLE
ncbi:MAG: helix-turn-helix domain-containing protein [Nitrososphaerota archaeon]|jgi:predicted transcriptional regulator|nr:helix-turn-helix domain-containing protein [Nitrososphaerota archaeon]MDG6960952.1 helix-turn-helix domain-containing protein [Nitrososphaerota archaeon]MDG6963174.1 helix-turn-helix domain-containing protein [Nitrososphaerota archaeon]MDG6969887.1 helix-turn-helix domain-containing protein [Nitrososphaerota archaeon]MDG6984011.1 helix-turn-helix domain-containing protein [Nitrososphaerota archaeon]